VGLLGKGGLTTTLVATLAYELNREVRRRRYIQDSDQGIF